MDNALPSIVVIDDSAEVRSLVRTRLELSKRITVVGDGANGMEAIGLAYRWRPSLLLLDLSMPGMDGLDALPGIREVSPTTAVVIYTGFEEGGIAEIARELGAAGFVEKSLPIERLVDELLEFLPQGSAPATGRERPARPPLAVIPDVGRLNPRDVEDQQVLDEHLESFREVFDEAAIGMATMTLTGSIIRANRALSALMHCEPEDLVGVDYGRLTAGRGDVLDAALDDIVTRTTDLAEIEHDVAGWPELRRARASLAAVRDSKGEALYVFLQVHDVTAEAEAAEKLRRSEERFRLLVEAVQEYAIFMLDPEGRVASWNTGAQRIKGYAAHEIIGQHFRVFYPAEQQEKRHPEFELKAALRDGRYEEEGWRVRKDGKQFWANVLITSILNETGEHVGFAKVTRDATERRRTEQERAESNAALSQANKALETLADRLAKAADDQARFLAITAHELRSPVAVLAGSADTLSRYWNRLADEQRERLLDGMTSSAGRLQRLLADLLAAARLDANSLTLQTQRISVAAVMESVTDEVRASAPMAEMSVRADHDIIVQADEHRLAQAIDNLVRNALRHGAPPVHLSAETQDGSALVRVSDSGQGVDADLQSQLFERFTTGDQLEGTGLGLYIARELAQAHGGDLTYEPPSDAFPAGAFVLAVPLA